MFFFSLAHFSIERITRSIIQLQRLCLQQSKGAEEKLVLTSVFIRCDSRPGNCAKCEMTITSSRAFGDCRPARERHRPFFPRNTWSTSALSNLFLSSEIKSRHRNVISITQSYIYPNPGPFSPFFPKGQMRTGTSFKHVSSLSKKNFPGDVFVEGEKSVSFSNERFSSFPHPRNWSRISREYIFSTNVPRAGKRR